MDNENSKCAHEICMCPRSQGSEYCSQHCEDAADADMTEIRCECGCPSCG